MTDRVSAAASPRPTIRRPFFSEDRLNAYERLGMHGRFAFGIWNLGTDTSWMIHGTCATAHNPDAWFPRNAHTPENRRALLVCQACPVLGECRAYVLEHDANGAPLQGIWGGTTASERRAILKARQGEQVSA